MDDVLRHLKMTLKFQEAKPINTLQTMAQHYLNVELLTKSLQQWFLILVLLIPCFVHLSSPLFNTADSDHQLVRRELYEPWTRLRTSALQYLQVWVQQHGQQRRPVNTTTCKHNALVYKSDWEEVSVDSVLVHQSCLWSSCAILV